MKMIKTLVLALACLPAALMAQTRTVTTDQYGHLKQSLIVQDTTSLTIYNRAAPIDHASWRFGVDSVTGEFQLMQVDGEGTPQPASFSLAQDGTISGAILPWANLSSKPTTLAGYGITDAVSSSGGTLTGNLYAPNIASDSSSGPAWALSADGTLTASYGLVQTDSDGILYASGLSISGNIVSDGGYITSDGSGGLSIGSLRIGGVGFALGHAMTLTASADGETLDIGPGGTLSNAAYLPTATQTQAWQGTATSALMTPDNVEQWGEIARPQQFRNTLRALNIIYNPLPSVSVTSITWSGNVATVTLASAPSLPLVAGDTFALSGATPTDYNTGWQIASVTDTTHFTFSTVGSAISAGATGTITFQQTAQLNLCAIGDSVARKKPKYLFPEITRGMPVNSISSQTYATGGDCVINNSDFTIEAAGGSFSLGSGTGWVTFGTGGTNPQCDTVTVIYAKESGAGIFKLQTSSDAGSPVTWTDISGYTSIDASSASLVAGVITLKFPYGYHGVRAMSVSGGRVRICNIISRAESTSGWNRGDLNQGGIAQSQMASEQSDFQSAEISATNPTLWSSEWKDSAATVPTYLPVLVSAFQAVKKADWIFNATTPVSSDAAYDSNPTTAPTYLENLETQKIARAGGYFYFGQGWWMWQTYAELLRLGLQGDGTHVNLVADYMMASVEAKDLWFLCAPPGNRSTGTEFVATQLGIGNTPSVPAIKWTINSGTGDVTIARGAGNYTYFDDPNGNHMMILSSSSASYANPSQLPGYILYGSGSTSTFMQVDGPSHAVLWRTATGNGTTNYYSDVDAPLRSLNTPAYFQQGGTYTLICGVGAIAANSTGNYTLPASPKQNGIYAISAMNVGWTLHQLAGQIIRSGSHVTTLGTSGSIDGTSADSITLLYTGTAGGNQEWRVIAGGDSSDLVYH